MALNVTNQGPFETLNEPEGQEALSLLLKTVRLSVMTIITIHIQSLKYEVS